VGEHACPRGTDPNDDGQSGDGFGLHTSMVRGVRTCHRPDVHVANVSQSGTSFVPYSHARPSVEQAPPWGGTDAGHPPPPESLSLPPSPASFSLDEANCPPHAVASKRRPDAIASLMTSPLALPSSPSRERAACQRERTMRNTEMGMGMRNGSAVCAIA
jgi:hypothetical protein